MFDFSSKNGRKGSATTEPVSATPNVAAPTGASIGAEFAALKQMVDGMPVNVMTLELDEFTIDFVNKTSIETLKPLEHLLPCKAEELVGQCVDIFHANPAHQRQLLSDAKNLPYQTNIKLGDEILDLLVTPIFDEAGNYSKPMLTWSVITEKVKLDAETARIREMVESMPINVMTLELENFTIDYANKTSVETLTPLEHLLPCKAADLVGQCVDIFHTNPEHQRKLLADPKNLPYQTNIKLGDEILDLLVTAIYDKDGNYLQPMLSWSVVTAKVKADAEAARVVQMVESMPINVMTLELEGFTIDYANKTSVETLTPLEHLLPCKAADLVGQCVDIFHTNPAHQRKLLADPKNLPYQTNIKLGDEILDLLVTAIFDKDGEYLQPMLSWSVVTEKVKADAEAARVVQMVESMPINVMTLELDGFTIDYANKTSIETLTPLEHLLPCKASELVGKCVDIFHANPEHQRKILSDPNNLPYNAQIKLGDEILDLLATAIYDKDGNYLQPMLSWSVITAKVKADEETERLMQMLDNMPMNIMTIDPADLTINYVNKTSIDTLRPLQSLLPCPVDEMMGKCIDIFHQNPSHQRNILADPNNLPHSAKIKLGDETLDLKVSAIKDKEGNYIGAMLNWAVVTAQVALADNFEANVKGIVEAVSSGATEMQGSAQSMSSTAEETSRQSTAVAAASEEASTNVQTVASAAEELSNSVEEVGRQVEQSNKIAQNAVEEAQRTNDKVQGLAEAAQKIGDVVNLINDIASQTNLLALNATIEAARAGEAGKGFAVVASEVKSLAGQTAKATEEIASQIGAIQAATTDAVGAIKGIGTTIGEISEIATTIATAVEQQSSATKEIAANVQQAAAGTQEVSQNISGVTQAASETGEAAGQVLGAAQELSKQSEALREQVDSFLIEVRAL